MKLNELKYNIQRFGLTPDRLMAYYGSHHDNLFIISIPKSGTHFLESILINLKSYRRSLNYRTIDINNLESYGGLKRIIRGKRNHIFFSHIPYREDHYDTLREANCNVIFLYRDPRDVLISETRYVANKTDHAWHNALRGVPSWRQQLEVMLKGDATHRLYSCLERYEFFEQWYNAPDVFRLRYEDLLLSIVRKDESAIGEQLSFLNLSNNQTKRIISKSVNIASPTYVNPGIEKYKNEKDFPLAMYERLIGDRLKNFHYEPKNSNPQLTP